MTCLEFNLSVLGSVNVYSVITEATVFTFGPGSRFNNRNYPDARSSSDSDQSGSAKPAAWVCSQAGILLGAISDQSSHCAVHGKRHTPGPGGIWIPSFCIEPIALIVIFLATEAAE